MSDSVGLKAYKGTEVVKSFVDKSDYIRVVEGKVQHVHNSVVPVIVDPPDKTMGKEADKLQGQVDKVTAMLKKLLCAASADDDFKEYYNKWAERHGGEHRL